MQFKVFEPGIEVNGHTVFSIVDGLGMFKSTAKKIMLSVNIGTEVHGEYKLDLNAWYPQEKWLDAFEIISKKIGETTLRQIGMKIPENAQFPPWVIDLDSAIKSIDVAYHMNHRKHGKPMFDPTAGTIEAGIGNYQYERNPGENLIKCVCRTPYPCAFDFGIVTSMARKFQSRATIAHDTNAPCRNKNGEACTYLISW